MTESIDFRRRALACTLMGTPWLARAAVPAPKQPVPILVYHRFAAMAVDSMTVRHSTFEGHLRVLQNLGCNVVALEKWVDWRCGKGDPLPARAVVLTADDGHRSQFEVMAPRLHERGLPATLFIYPSAISNASYAMTWSQLRELVALPGFSVQSHTYWHPNLVRERQRQAADAFQRFADNQLRGSSAALQRQLSQAVSLLAWPFGLSDEALWAQAQDCGYRAAFSLGNRSATANDPLFAVPRHLMVDAVGERQLSARLEAAFAAGNA